MVPPIEVFSNLTVLLHRLALNFHDQTVPLEAWSAKGQTPSRFLKFLSFHVLTEALLEFSSSFFIDEFRLYFHLTWNHRTNFFLKFRNVKLEPHYLLKCVFYLWRIFRLLISVFLNDKLILQNVVMQWQISQIIADVQEMLW